MTMRTTSYDPVVEQPTRRVDNPGVQTTDGTGPVRAPGQPTQLQTQYRSPTSILTESVVINGDNCNAEDTRQRASHSTSSMDKLGIVEFVAAALRTRATTSGTRRSPRTRWPCEASKVPTFFDGAYMVYFVEEAPAGSSPWDSYATSSMSSWVASQLPQPLRLTH